MQISRLCTLIALALLAGCQTNPAKKNDLGHAVTAPLSDLNLVRDKIPAVLQVARSAPYAVPEDTSCKALAAHVVELNDVLGNDVDTLSANGEHGFGADDIGDAAVSAIRNTTEGVIPFRGWIRKLTGAERHSREVAATIFAGSARRAFLKGLAVGKGCEPLTTPAASKAD
jgi:hypothetical protein